MDQIENPMVRDECWPEYNTIDYEDEAYLDWWDTQIDEALGK